MLEFIKNDFPAFQTVRNSKPPVYLDNACTTLVPQSVIDAQTAYYTRFPACGGWRSRHWFATEVNDRIEGNEEKGIKGSRRTVQEFINASSPEEIIFTLNATHAINIVALGFDFNSDDTILLTDKEHNSNLIPWLRLQKDGIIKKVDYVDSREDDTFDMNLFEKKLKMDKVRLVSMAYTSNLTGYTIPAKEIIELAHACGAKVLLDAAQTVPHQAIDVQALGVDYMAFSIHKMCGPRGVGILYVKKELLGGGRRRGDRAKGTIEPVVLGGGTIFDTTHDAYELLEPPECFEAGLQNYSSQVATAAAVNYLKKLGMDEVKRHENELNTYLTAELLRQYGDTGWFHILGPQPAALRSGILTFEIKRPNGVGIAEELSDRANIMIRDGMFCVHSYLNKIFGKGWTEPRLPEEHRMTYRISMYFYNTREECKILLDTIHTIFEERSYI